MSSEIFAIPVPVITPSNALFIIIVLILCMFFMEISQKLFLLKCLLCNNEARFLHNYYWLYMILRFLRFVDCFLTTLIWVFAPTTSRASNQILSLLRSKEIIWMDSSILYLSLSTMTLWHNSLLKRGLSHTQSWM